MNLQNGQITIAQLLEYPPAQELLAREFPQLARHPMLHRAGRITLNTAIVLAGDALPAQRRHKLIAQLESL